jgi:hypothetical protein
MASFGAQEIFRPLDVAAIGNHGSRLFGLARGLARSKLAMGVERAEMVE